MRISDWSSDVCSSDLSQGSELTGKWDALDYGGFKRRQHNADFGPPDAEAAPALFLRERVSPKRNQLIDSRQPRGRSGPAQKQIETANLFEPGQTLIPRDRKSTRLNSSH